MGALAARLIKRLTWAPNFLFENDFFGTFWARRVRIHRAGTDQGVAFEENVSSFSGTVTLTYDYHAVPEPSSLALIVSALICFCGVLRLRRA